MQATLAQKAYIIKALMFHAMGQSAAAVGIIDMTPDERKDEQMKLVTENAEYTLSIARSFAYHNNIGLLAKDLHEHKDEVARRTIVVTMLSPDMKPDLVGLTAEMFRVNA